MINLVTIKQAERHLHLDIDEVTVGHVPDLEDKIQQASFIVLDYIKQLPPEYTSPVLESPTYTFWANDTTKIPYNVKAATLLVLAELWDNREASVNDCLSQAVKDLLHRWRDPALA